MDNQNADVQNVAAPKKTYVAPQLQALDDIANTQGKSTHFTETGSNTFGPSS